MTRMIWHPLEHTKQPKPSVNAMVVNSSRLFFYFFSKTGEQNLECDVTKNCTIAVKGLKLASNN